MTEGIPSRTSGIPNVDVVLATRRSHDSCDLDPSAEAVAVDARDDGHRHLADRRARQVQAGDVGVGRDGVELDQLADVGPAHERPVAGPRQDDGAEIRVAVQLPHRVRQLPDEGRGEDVQPCPVVDGDAGDAARAVRLHELAVDARLGIVAVSRIGHRKPPGLTLLLPV